MGEPTFEYCPSCQRKTRVTRLSIEVNDETPENYCVCNRCGKDIKETT